MANLLTLPDEILIIIIRLLDVKSVHTLYELCSRFQEIIRNYKVVKICHMSCNRMSSAHFLHIPFFKDIAQSIQELNLSCVDNLDKKTLLPAMKSLRSLRSIDVSCTKVGINDFLNIFNHCPTIIEVTIDSIFDKRNSRPLQCIHSNVLLKCQDVFKNFKRIHFVGSLNNLIFNNYTMFMLQKTKNIILQYSISPLQKQVYNRFPCIFSPIIFHKFFIVTINTEHNIRSVNDPYFPRILNKYEFIIITLSTSITRFYCTPLFVNFFKKKFDLFPSQLGSFYCQYPASRTVLFFWNKDTNKFNNTFYRCLLKQLQPYFVHHINVSGKEQVPSLYERFCVKLDESHFQNSTNNSDSDEPLLKKNRIGPSNVLIDYDYIFKDKDKINLSMCFNFTSKQYPIALSPTSNFLSKLTYLSLTGLVAYSAGFFNVLFRCCFQLETINYEDCRHVNYINYIARSMPLSKSIKNIRLSGKRIDGKILITFLSQCRSLENVHILELSPENFELNDYQPLIQNCKNLYCLHIYSNVNKSLIRKQLMNLNKSKLKSQQHILSVNMINMNMEKGLLSNPFASVFSF